MACRRLAFCSSIPRLTTLFVRLRRDWGAVGNDEDIEVLRELENDLQVEGAGKWRSGSARASGECGFAICAGYGP